MVLDVDDRWEALLESAAHDFYAFPCFTALDASWVSGSAIAYLDSKIDLLIPLVRRELGDDHFDAVSPYGYPGIVSDCAPDLVRAALLRFLEEGRREGFVTSFLRLHPLLNAELPHALQGLPGCTIVEHGPTVSVSLDDNDEAWEAGLSKGLRRDIRALRREGYHVDFDSPDALDSFMVCYRASMKRVDADDSYLFDRDYIERLLDCLRERITICVVRSAGGEPACAGLFTVVGEIAQYHLSGTNPNHFALGPNKLMLAEARKWVREQGAQVFHLGGGVGSREDGLFRFKERFGSRLTPFWTVRLIHDAEHYEVLQQSWLDQHGISKAPDPSYFPLYRQPLG